MNDYFDLWVLLRNGTSDSDRLMKAIRATLERRGTALPTSTPFGLSDAFAQDAMKLRQWQAFLAKNTLVAPGLEEIIATLRETLTKDL